MKKTICLLFGMLILMITMTSCGKSENEKQIIGTWRYDGSSYVSVLTFNDDMTCSETMTASINSSDMTYTKFGSYEIDKNLLMIYFDGNMEYLASIRFEDNKMIWLSVFDDTVYVRE